MPKYFFIFLLNYLFLINTFAQTATEEELVISAKIIEQNKGTLQAVRNFPISITGLGVFTSDEAGVIVFPIQFDDNLEQEIFINLNTTNYQIRQPFEGKILLDTTHLTKGFEILIIGKDIEGNLKKQIDKLQQQLKNIKAESSLSTSRLNAINDSLLQVILIHEQERLAMQEAIITMEKELISTKEDKTELEKTVEELKYQLELAQEKNRALQNELVEALAENLRLQTEYLSVITGTLNTYLLRAKDLQHTLKTADQYYKGYKANYDRALNEYGQAYLKVYDAHQGYIQNVANAWQSKKVKTEVEKTFNILINELHDSKMVTIFDEVNAYIGARKMRKVSNYSEQSYEELSPIIYRLETNIKRLTKTMKYTMQ